MINLCKPAASSVRFGRRLSRSSSLPVTQSFCVNVERAKVVKLSAKEFAGQQDRFILSLSDSAACLVASRSSASRCLHRFFSEVALLTRSSVLTTDVLCLFLHETQLHLVYVVRWAPRPLDASGRAGSPLHSSNYVYVYLHPAASSLVAQAVFARSALHCAHVFMKVRYAVELLSTCYVDEVLSMRTTINQRSDMSI